MSVDLNGIVFNLKFQQRILTYRWNEMYCAILNLINSKTSITVADINYITY
jgi:hypothetical protein